MSMIGQSVVKWDAYDKARGAFCYPSDLSLPGMLHVKVLRSSRPHARLAGIEVKDALSSAGVACVLTARDVPGINRFGLVTPDQPVLCEEIVRFCGDAIAIVAAETEAQARSALAKIDVKYVDLPTLFDPRKALGADAPHIHEGGNLCSELRLGFGDVPAVLAASAHVVKIAYATGRQEHAYLETEAGIAFYDEQGRVCITCGGQNPFADRSQLAMILDLPEDRIWVKHPPMGGAFGGKEDLNVQAVLALVLMHTGRPARMAYDRSESIAFSVKRHRFEVEVEVGADSDGKVTAFRADILVDTGAYRTLGPSVLTLAAEHAPGPYRFAASEISGRVVHTNNGNASAFRGFGNPQVILGIEQAMDELAGKLGCDPLEFRCHNLLKKGDRAGAGHIVTSDVSLHGLAKRARESVLRSPPETNGSVRRATGFAFVWQGFGLGPGVEQGSTVSIRRDKDDGFILDCSAPDLGEGNSTAFMQIAADTLGCSLNAVRLKNGSTDEMNAWSTNASRSVAVTGSAVLLAARAVRKRIDAGENGEIEETAHYSPDLRQRLVIGAPHIDYAYGIQLVRIALDTVTGAVTVEEAETYLDPGQVINPDGVSGQVEGGFAQGLGFALFEELALQDGMVLNDRLSSYIIPTIRDVPSKLRTILHSTPSPSNPLGVRGIAEVGLTPVAAATANALASLTGRRFDVFPVRPETLLPFAKGERP
ncbi:molybdopterin-dependent oxidoreductase [Neorhizobium sp. CSC1952]|uniref:xanthine dehydrogenase family protein molybdopterin-binding subunit n=1 Tax=Neorhizobium sp. CSC1952 TaxID=2978974 RepID=UPI0025A53B39|nr:molybdopterin cofactor-binding domain-containing protein [Rhizobium sp. CSC1952]WJR66330.1 molybdopterin-dependent oxidoreductase [Rhizobium sp. CSC1952]